jgi:hypothetical protein
MNYSFLLILILFVCLLIIVQRRVKFPIPMAPLTLGIAAGGLLNLLMSFAFIDSGLLAFNSPFKSHLSVAGIPLEQVLLCLILPYLFLVIYYALNASYPLIKTDKYSLSISNLLMGLCIAMIFFAYTKMYAVSTFGLLLFTLFFLEYRNSIRFMLPFYRAYVVALIPFLIFFVPLHAMGAYTYAVQHTIALKIAYIPFELYFYFLCSSLITLAVCEFKKHKEQHA